LDVEEGYVTTGKNTERKLRRGKARQIGVLNMTVEGVSTWIAKTSRNFSHSGKKRGRDFST